MEAKKDIFIEGENIENLFSDDLHPFLKWGMTWLFVVGLLLFGMTYFLKWPEVVKAPAVLTSSTSPAALVPKVQAPIAAVYFKNGDTVQQGDVLFTLANTASVQNVSQLDSLIADLDQLYQSNIEMAVSLPIAYFELDELGEMQNGYEQFLRAYNELQFALSDQFMSSKLSLIFSRYKTLNDLGQNLKLQRNTIYVEYENALKTYEQEKVLYEKGSISAYDLQNTQSAMHGKRLNFQNIKNSIIQNERQKQDLLEQKIQLTQGIQSQKNNFIQAFKNLKAAYYQWKNNYQLVSPIDGIVSIPVSTQKDAIVSPQAPAMYILPENAHPVIQIQLPQRNFNQIDTSKTVRIKLSAYPCEEFGVLEGKIIRISKIPVEGQYDAVVELTKGLNTSFGKDIEFINGMEGEAEIILNDERLMIRLFRKVFK